jgi:hypothetical protein
MMPKRRRWDCPAGEHAGQLAPARLRKDDIRRYCIPCSTKSGRLTERVAPSLVRESTARAAARTRRASAAAFRAAERESKRWIFDGVDMRAEFQRLLALPAFRPVRSSLKKLTLSIYRGRSPESSGHHKLHQGTVHVTIGTGPWYLGSATLLHELCHGAHWFLGLTGTRRQRYRMPSGQVGVALRHAFHDAAFHDLLRIAAVQAYRIDGARLMELHRDAGGSRKAYSMDEALRHALAEHYGAERQTVLLEEERVR